MKYRKQTVSKPDNWLYRDYNNNDGTLQARGFSKFAFLGVNDSELPECTNEEKLAWEEEHKQEEENENI